MMAGLRRWRGRLYWRWRLRWLPRLFPPWRRRPRRLLALLAAVLVAGSVALFLFDRSGAASELAGPAGVTDADTLTIGGRAIRLDGLDAPELRQTCRRADGAAWPCGQMAAAALAVRLRGEEVRCRLLGEDRFGRALGRCQAGGEEINAWLVREGWAVAYTRYSWRYLPQQAQAWWAGRGIWQGSFEAPEEWRSANR